MILLAVNAAVAGLLLLAAYSPYIQPAVHPVWSCFGLAFPVFAVLNGGFLVFWLCFGRYKSALLPLAGLLACAPQLRTYCPVNFRTGELPEGCSKILSYNIMGFGNGAKQGDGDAILEYLRESGADIICLQEYRATSATTHPTQKEVERALAAYPYRRSDFVGQGRSNRVACYSKFPILSAREVKLTSSYNGAVVYELQWGTDTLTLINAHLESNKLTRSDKAIYENLLTDPEKENIRSSARLLVGKLAEASALRAPQADAIAGEIRRNGHPYLVVCGDFNDSPISYAHRVIARQLDDAFTQSGCGLGISYNQNRFYFRIDNILVSKNLASYRCTVDRSIRASDHYPIWCHVKKKP